MAFCVVVIHLSLLKEINLVKGEIPALPIVVVGYLIL